MAEVRLENVSKSYGDHSVHRDLNLTINDGECFVLLGPSGCGKTVLLRMISGFEKPDKGRIYINDNLMVDGETSESVNTDLRGLGMVFQDYAVWPHMTVFKNIAYPLKIKNEKADVIKEKVMEIVDITGLTGMDQRLPSQLSGGQQQRVALGRALISKPSLLLLDEPLNNLDANLREEMRFEIKELQKKLGTTVIYVSHDQEIALAIADRVAVMDKHGTIMQVGTPVEVFESPINDNVFQFMGVSNFIPVKRKGKDFFVGNKQLYINPENSPEGEDLIAAFRPSDIYFKRDGQGTEGTILRSSFLGSTTDFLIDIGEGHSIRTQVDTFEAISQDLMLEEGEKCYINFHGLNLYDKAVKEESH